MLSSGRQLLAAIGFAAMAIAGPTIASAKEAGSLKVDTVGHDASTLLLHWKGTVGGNMAQQIEQAFQAQRNRVKRVQFVIDSGGGSVAEGERAIAVLRQIRRTHPLETVVGHGKLCGSMCVFIYMQGQKRVAALTSSWLFHEISHAKNDKIVKLDRTSWEGLIDKYLVPEGVSREWIAKMKPLTNRIDYWQTGSDLVNDRSGIIHEALGNQKGRIVHDGRPPGPPVKRIAVNDPQPRSVRPAPSRSAELPAEREKTAPQITAPAEPAPKTAAPAATGTCQVQMYDAVIPCNVIAALIK